MPRTIQQLGSLIETGNAKECVAFLLGASESERQGLATFAEKSLRDVSKFVANLDEQTQTRRQGQKEAARLAVIATCSISTIKSVDWRILPIDDDVIQILAERRPAWLPEFAEHLLDGDRIAWEPVRRMVRAGLISRPQHQNYVLGMTHHFMGVGGWSSSSTGDRKQRTILTHLEEEPDLLEEVWQLFEIEGGGEYSLAAHDKYSREDEGRWDWSLVELSRRNTLSRARLLDASLSALDRGFAQFRSGWFSAFHELLQPTVDERLSRIDLYLRLLASPIPPTVTFALNAVEIVDHARPLSANMLVEGLRPLMLSRGRGTAKSGLKLLERVAGRDPSHGSVIALVASEGLVHEASDVQASAMGLIASCGSTSDDALVAAVTKAADAVAASVRKGLNAWLTSGHYTSKGSDPIDKKGSSSRARGSAEAPRSRPTTEPTRDLSSRTLAGDIEKRIAKIPAPLRILSGLDAAIAALGRGQLNLSALNFDGTEFPRLDPACLIAPIKTLDELIDLAAAVLENSEDIDQIERLYDGVSRLCDQRPRDFEQRTGPLLKRLRGMLKRNPRIPFTGHDPAADVIGVILAWLVGDYGAFKPTKLHGQAAVQYTLGEATYSFPVPNHDLIGGSMANRARQLSDRIIQQNATATLCAPTHAGGWVDPIQLVERVNDKLVLQQATDLEKVLALLRLAPDQRDVASSRLTESKDEFVSVLRYAFGVAVKKVGTTDWLWIAATRARQPFADDELIERQHPQRGPDAGKRAMPTISVERKQYTVYKYSELTMNVEPVAATESTDGRLLTPLMWNQADVRLGPEFVSAAGVGQLFQIWPSAQEAACASGVIVLASNLDWSEAQWHNRGFLQPLLDPDLPLRPMATLLLVLGLAAKEPGEHGLATDVAIAAIDDGRLDGVKLGTAMGGLLTTGLIKAARWAKTLEHVSRASQLHAEVVRESIARALDGEPAAMPKDLHALVDLLKELLAESPVEIQGTARQFLEQVAGTGKLGKAAKLILATKTEIPSERLRTIQQRAVDGRLARCERWMGRNR